MATTAEPVEELLRRCHHDELVGLARMLRINPSGLLHDALARASVRTLRRFGGNAIGNVVLRRGEGPAYDVLLPALARRCGLAPRGDIAEMELQVAVWSLIKAWDKMTPDARATTWADLHLDSPVPRDGRAAVDEARDRLGPGFAYAASHVRMPPAARVALAVLPMLNPFTRLMSLFWLTRPRDELLVPAVTELCRLRTTVRHRVTVGLVGSPSSGKDAGIKAIFGVDTGNVSPIAGSTKQVAIQQLPGATALYVVNTPGMGDVIEAITEEARQVLDHIDVFVYVVNAQGGVQARERDDYGRCKARGRPVLAVVNKIDTLRPSDRERLTEDCRVKLGAHPDDLLPVAFDPLPQLSEHPIGMDAVHTWLTSRLVALGKDPAELPWNRPAQAER